MNSINNQNIARFIAQLYRERNKTEAPPELLNAWTNLSDVEIQTQLSGLFASWGKSVHDLQLAKSRFLQAQQRTQALNTSTYSTSPTNSKTAYTTSQYPTYPETKTNGKKMILGVLFFLFVAVGGFFVYHYIKYNALTRIYAITENIAVRNKEGKLVGRMDLYPKTGTEEKSYSNLRALDNQVYQIQPEGSNKVYPSRKALMDDASFSDYLWNNEDKICYVNVNYIVNDKKEFKLFQNAFKEIQNVKSDNDKLNASIRKIIVGAMAQDASLENSFLLSRANGLSAGSLKNTISFLVQSISKNGDAVVIAGLDNGSYYRFSGNTNEDKFNPPTIIQLQTEDGAQGPLSGNYRFIKSGSDWRLYSVDKKETIDYALDMNNAQGLFVYKPIVTTPSPEEIEQQEEDINNAYQESLEPVTPPTSGNNIPGN